MLVISKRQILFRGLKDENYLLSKDVLTSVPSWVSQSSYFKALVQDGKIAVAESTKDKAVEKAIEKSDVVEQEVKKAKKAKKAEEPKAEEASE